jgi:iron complex transport system permease protein
MLAFIQFLDLLRQIVALGIEGVNIIANYSHKIIDTEEAKRVVIVLCALLVGVTVALAGIIGFVGLVIPHLVRLVIGPDHRRLLPACALLGASLLTLADLLCRTVAAPAEIPIGIVTALLGAPFFFWLLRREFGRL